MSLNKKFTIFLSIIFFCFIGGISAIYAQYLTITSEDINVPKELDSEIKQYVTPKSVVIVPISPPSNDLDILDTDLYKGMYYYQVTRYNLSSISFHYIITEDGTLIKNDQSVPDRKIEVENTDIESPIIVGYITQKGSIRFNPIAKAKVGAIILDIINQNSIPLESVFIKGIKFTESAQREFKISFEDIFIGWQSELDKIIQDIEPNYVPVEKTYSVEIKDIEIPFDEVEVGTTVEGSLSIMNSGNFVIYGGTDTQLLLSQVEGDEDAESKFFVNDVWVSPTQISLMDSNQIIMPGQEVDLKFSLSVPLDIGNIAEKFKVTNITGAELSDSIDVSLNVKKPEGEIVEILETDTGYLNVRGGSSLNDDEVTRVSPGQRFFVIERKAGWVHIKVNQDLSGWVFAKYVKTIE